MKLIKGFALLSFNLLVFGSCFDPPEFSVVPEIEFERVEFIDVPDPSIVDSLVLYIRFKDGDGDLGLGQPPLDATFPFNDVSFYQENNGKLTPLYTTPATGNGANYEELVIPNPQQGKLVTYSTRQKPEYSFLPPLASPQNADCLNYETLGGAVPSTDPEDGARRKLLIEKTALPVLGSSVEIVDSFAVDGKIAYYQIRDQLYTTRNQNHYNIEVDFFVKDDPSSPDGFREFDWTQEFCTTFDGRFPVFSDKLSSIEGTLRYNMKSVGFTTLFSIKTLKLRVTIKDRALNASNTIETPEFTLF